ncbi:MAG TPA: hypothetical protein VGB50_03735 [Flavobacterium sp.]|jgi:hypothetical protein
MTNRRYLNTGFALLFASLAFVSCDNRDEDTLEDVRMDKPSVTIDRTEVTAAEGEELSFTLTVDEPLSSPMDFKLELVNDESTGDFRDFTSSGTETNISEGGYSQGPIGYNLQFPAYATSYTFTITPPLDFFPEGDETLKLLLRSSGNGMGLVAEGSQYITINVTNTVSNDFIAELAWSGNYTDTWGSIQTPTYMGQEDQEFEYCGFDFDLEIYTEGFDIVESSYSNCPEITTLSSDAPDGNYIVVATFYTNQISDPVPPLTVQAEHPLSGEIVFPVKLTLSKPGAFVHTVDMTGLFRYSAGGFQQGNNDALVPVALVTKTGNTYSVADYNNPAVVWAQGKLADIKSILASKKMKK